MKICDKCKDRSEYDINIQCQALKKSGLASWDINMCSKCMDEFETLVKEFIGVGHDV